MRLYLMRHGKALDVGEHGVHRDSERPLSDKGAEIVREVALGLAVLGTTPDLVVTSPLLRTRQTAEIVAEVLGGVAVTLSPLLAPSGHVPDIVEWLHKNGGKSLFLVGHMPDLAELTSLLLCNHVHGGIDFKKAGVCCLSFLGRPSPGTGCLDWFLPPTPLGLLARQASPPRGTP